jgi:Pyruvate phosphate dikinase, AMP/ATP-binding domain
MLGSPPHAQVWASKWNDRAWLSRRARGVPDDALYMAALIQQVLCIQQTASLGFSLGSRVHNGPAAADRRLEEVQM